MQLNDEDKENLIRLEERMIQLKNHVHLINEQLTHLLDDADNQEVLQERIKQIQRSISSIENNISDLTESTFYHDASIRANTVKIGIFEKLLWSIIAGLGTFILWSLQHNIWGK